MIVVIADDISGAAELAGAALRHGMTAEVQTRFEPSAQVDVVCVDTDTRSLSPEKAAQVVGDVAREVAEAGPAWIFKKCDSVLRGHVLVEVRAIMSAIGAGRAVIVPANPSRGRTIRNGHYFINDQPLHDTAFARDIEHPRTTSRVSELLGGAMGGMFVPDVASAADISRHATAMTGEMLAAGGLDFFEAILRRRVAMRAENVEPAMPRASGAMNLLVCGSAMAWPARRNDAVARGFAVFTVPHDLGAVARALRTTGRAVLGIGDGASTRGVPPTDLVQSLAHAVAELLPEVLPDRVLLEGGATAAAVVRALGWSRLRVGRSPAPGIGSLIVATPKRPLLLIKPGSYPWPAEIWPG